jgi:hypothetical protein
MGGVNQSATAQPLSPLPPPQTEGGGQQTPLRPLLPPQTEGGGGGGANVSTVGDSGNLHPGSPFHFTVGGDFRDNANTEKTWQQTIPRLF